MKKPIYIVRNLLFISLLFVLSGCKNSYDDMISAFNQKNFSPETPVEKPYSVNDLDFNPTEMLEGYYVFSDGFYAYLEAPEDGTEYKWEYVDEKENKVLLSDNKVFYYKVPGVFKIGDENTLILTVTAANSLGEVTEYIDKSIIIIKSQSDSGMEE